MTGPQLRMILVTLIATGAIVVACARRATHVDTAPTSTLGESTASAPADPSAPAPDAAGPREVSSGPITGSTSGVPAQPPASSSGGTGPVASGGTLPVDIAPMAADGGVTGGRVDGGTRTGDAGRPGLTDGGTPTIDGGTRTIDAGAPRADGGVGTVDGGSPTRP
jgi:hypothetical protein